MTVQNTPLQHRAEDLEGRWPVAKAFVGIVRERDLERVFEAGRAADLGVEAGGEVQELANGDLRLDRVLGPGGNRLSDGLVQS